MIFRRGSGFCPPKTDLGTGFSQPQRCGLISMTVIAIRLSFLPKPRKCSFEHARPEWATATSKTGTGKADEIQARSC